MTEIEKDDFDKMSTKDVEEQALPEEVVNGVSLQENEKVSLEVAETELSFSSGKVEKFLVVDKKLEGGKSESFGDKFPQLKHPAAQADDRNKKWCDDTANDLLPSQDKSISQETESQVVFHNFDIDVEHRFTIFNLEKAPTSLLALSQTAN